MEEYLVPSGEGIDEHTEKRSRFIGHIWRTDTEEEALAAIKATRESMWDARHHVYAYIIRGGAMRYSDDGEPQGTGGMPVLDVLRRQELQNVCCVVTRYFGGILLGTGGLVRAYSKAAAMAVDAAGVSIMRLWQRYEIPCPYPLFERVKLEVEAHEGQIAAAEYGAQVDMTVRIPMGRADAFAVRLTDLSSGKLVPVDAGTEYLPGPYKRQQRRRPV